MIEEKLGRPVELEPGGPGQFDVMLDDEVVATRAKGWQRFLGGGWPEPDDVVTTLRGRGVTG